MNPFTLRRGRAPLLISLPHDGMQLPPALLARLSPEAAAVPDTDWWMSKLYGPVAGALEASLIVPTFSRYLIDLNRPPDDSALYPGQNSTGLCPTTRFDGGPVYRDGQAPSADEVAERVERWWRPYHAALAEELATLRDRHGRVLLWDGHSIASRLPWLFEGELPALNLGTAQGRSCRPATEARLAAVLEAQEGFSWVINGRFKGGFITRHYGRPEAGVEAVQLETAQRAYMVEPNGAFEAERAAPLQALLQRLLSAALLAQRQADPGV